MHPSPETDADAAQLAALGHKSELNRNFSPLAMLGLAFAILNSWTALAASFSLALPSGGPTSVLWGLMSEWATKSNWVHALTSIAAGVCNLALAISLAEFLSAYPTAGGQYHVSAYFQHVPGGILNYFMYSANCYEALLNLQNSG